MTTRLAALVRRQLVRPDRAQIAGDDGYRFRHLLIRDAAYDALPKAVRADLHARFAGWLDEHGTRARRARRDRRLPPRAGQPVTWRSSGSRTPTLPTAPPRDSPLPATVRSTVRTTRPEPRCSLEQPNSYARTGLDVALELESAWTRGSSMCLRQRNGGGPHRTRRGCW